MGARAGGCRDTSMAHSRLPGIRRLLLGMDAETALEVFRTCRDRYGTPTHCERLEQHLQEIVRLQRMKNADQNRR